MSKVLATSKVAASLIALGLVVSFAVAFATPAKAATVDELQAQVAALMAQIAGMGGSTTTTSASCNTFTRNHSMGNSGGEVMWIQQFLNKTPATQVATSGSGSPGMESSYFGAKTKAAVMKFQSANGITPVSGYWGPLTRAKANSMCTTTGGTTTGGTTTGTAGTVSVSAAAQPANSLAPQGAARVPFTKFVLTNNSGSVVTVNGVTVERVGLGQDAVFSGIALVDSNNVQIGTSKTLNSNHQATIGDTFTLNPGESKTLTVAGNMNSSLSSYAGQVLGIQVNSVNTTGTVSGSFPIAGAMHTINATLAVGSVSTSTSAFDPGSNQQRNIGDTGVRFSGVKFTANSAEDLRLYSIRWRQVGSASASDVSNLMTNVNGTDYPVTVDASGKYYTSVFPGGVLIPKGDSIEVYIKGDLNGGNSASRTVRFDIDKVTDVYFVGQLYGYGVAPSGTFQPWLSTYTVTINAGTVTTISKANEVAAQNIASNVSNQPLGGFATNFAGESVSTNNMVFTFATSSATVGLLTSVSLVDENGKVVAGPVDATTASNYASTGNQIVTFTDSVTFPTGRHVYTLKGKVPSTAGNGAAITASTVPSGWGSVTGQSSGNSITISVGSFSMNQMTVKSGAITVGVSTQPASQNIVAGAQQLTIANIQLDASQSGEDVRLASLPINFSGTVANMSGCQIWDGTTALNTGSRVLNSVSSGNNTMSFDNSFVVPKGTVKTLAVACNVSSGAANNDTIKAGIDSTATYAITGVTSGTTITPTITSGTSYGGTMTVASGSFAVTVDPSSPSYANAAAGSTGVTLGVVKLRASNEAVNLQKLGLSITTSTASSTDIGTVYLYAGNNIKDNTGNSIAAGTLLGTAIFTGANSSATSTLSTTAQLPKDVDATIVVKGDLAGIGTSLSGTAGHLLKVDPLNAEGSGVGSGQTVRVGATGGVAGVRTFKSVPTVAQDTLSSTGLNSGQLLRFKVTADSHGPVGLYKMTFNIASSSGVTVTNVVLKGYTDASYSNGISSLSNAQFGTTAANITSGSDFSFTQSTPVQVPAGTTYYFEVTASLSGVTSGSSLVTKLVGDSSYFPVTNGQYPYYVATATNASLGNFIWSGNSTTTAATTDVDWANGYNVSGLPSSGVIQTRSQ